MKKLLLLPLIFLFVSCATSTSIFPSPPTDVDDINNGIANGLPNPISLVVDAANNQLVVVNSNVDFFFETGTLMTISVDATDPDSPVLTATSIIETLNYGGQIALNGINAYVPFRESNSEGKDQLFRFQIGNGSITPVTQVDSEGDNPFGLGIDGTNILVVSEHELNFYNANLSPFLTIDLNEAEARGIEDADSLEVENVAVDTVNDYAFITNRNGKIFVVDLSTNTFTHVIRGPTNTRGITFDGTYLYVVDGDPASLWIFDASLLTTPGTTPSEVDDSTLLIDVLDLNSNPNGIAVDTVTNKAFIANSTDRSISVVSLNPLSEIDEISLLPEDSGVEGGEDPFSLKIGTFGGQTYLFVTNITSNNIFVIRTDTHKLVKTFP